MSAKQSSSRQNSSAKAHRFNWKPTSTKGRLEWIDKFLIGVDHVYQRDNVSNSRVLEIAKEWDWRACGTIGLAKRADGSYWAYDGQHRVLAARKRDDVQDLPCWVFDTADVKDEAAGYVLANTVRGPMRAIEKFKARLVAEDAIALQVAAMVDGIGYAICAGAAEFTLTCVESIEQILRRDHETADTVLQFCGELFSGQPINSRILKGLAVVHAIMKKNGSRITATDTKRKLIAAGPEQLLREISKCAEYLGKGGERVYAAGIIKFLNKGRRVNRIPSPIE